MNGEFPGNNIDLPGMLIRAEEEGLTDMVDTRQAKINAIANKIDKLKRKQPSADVMEYIDGFIESEDIDIDSLTASERKKINRHL
ncbi:MAG: hypothetical protein WCK26_02305 [Candidatus Saccharibacteria bacterium]